MSADEVTNEARDDIDRFLSVLCDVFRHDMEEDIILARMDRHFFPTPAALFSNQEEQNTLQMASARSSGSSTCCGSQVVALLGGLADQQVVRSRGGMGSDAEERMERGMPCPTPIEAEHELVEVVLEVGLAQSVIDAQTPTLEV